MKGDPSAVGTTPELVVVVKALAVDFCKADAEDVGNEECA